VFRVLNNNYYVLQLLRLRNVAIRQCQWPWEICTVDII